MKKGWTCKRQPVTIYNVVIGLKPIELCKDNQRDALRDILEKHIIPADKKSSGR